MSRYEDLREQTEAAEGDQLSRLGALVWKAYEAGDITSEQMHQLDEVWHRRFALLASVEPEQQVIPLANLHRLDLKPGDRLAVILPEGIVSPKDVHEFRRRIQDQLDAWAPDVRAIVFPHGTQLDVVSGERGGL